MNFPTEITELHSLIEAIQSELSELKQKYLALEKENILLWEENARLKQENSELRSQLDQNSTNSSKPPSSDGYKKQPAFARKKGGAKGGKKGHKGNTLRFSDNVDLVVGHKPQKCNCGCSLQNIPARLVEKRQVFDLPQPKLEITEHRLYAIICPACQKTNQGSFPDQIKAPVQYGTGVKAFTTLLNNSYKLPFGKISQLFLDLFGIPINGATIFTANNICYQKLKPTQDIIKAQILKSRVANADETGLRVEGKLHWLHNISTVLFTYLFVHGKRGKKALESEQSIISSFFGWLVHDCWSSYFSFRNLKHAVCNAHILREFQGLMDNDRKWAKTFKTFLLSIKQMPYEQRIARRTHIEARYDKICNIADLYEPKPENIPGKKGKLKRTKGRNLLKRLIQHKSAVLAFAFNQEVPFTNNLAERDVRPAKIKQKISGCFRTKAGADTYARIESFISSARKNNLNIFKELKDTFNGFNHFTLNYSTC